MPKLAPKTLRQRRERILDAAERCFIGKGFHHTTMDEICREAGVSPGALYTYFASKEALIEGLCQREKDRLGKELAKTLETSDFLSALRRMAEHFCFKEPIEKVRLQIEIAAEVGRNPLVGKTVRSVDRAVSEDLLVLLQKEKEEGRVNPNFPLETVVRVLNVLGDGHLMRRNIDPDFDPISVIPAMMTMIEALLAPVPVESARNNDRKAG